MNTAEKTKFVADLCGAVVADITAKIEAGKIPAEWDGHELRALLDEKFHGEAARSLALMRGKRLRDFKNTVIVDNL